MNQQNSRQRLYACLLLIGASILLSRTIIMIIQGNLRILVPWVSFLLVAELLIDLSCAVFSVIWWISNDVSRDSIPLKLGATAAILHAFRVLVFVIGRLGPWIDFDIKPEQRVLHDTNGEIGWIYFAAIMSILSIIGVVVIWRLRRRTRKTT